VIAPYTKTESSGNRTAHGFKVTLTIRPFVARLAGKTGSYNAIQWACGRIAGGFVLAYHDSSAHAFEQQIDALRPNEPVHLGDLFDRRESGRNTAGLFAITVDDGVGNTVRAVGSVCRRRGWPVTFYVPTSYLDDRLGLPFQLWLEIEERLPQTIISLPTGTLDFTASGSLERFKRDVRMRMATQPRECYKPLIEELADWLLDHGLLAAGQLKLPEPISWTEVEELSQEDAIRFESHGVSHTAVSALSPDTLRSELLVSKHRISEHTNRDCRHFCYPFGGVESIGAAAPSIVAEIYQTAVTMTRGRLAGHPRWLLPRIPIYERDDGDVVRLKILTT
jgi:peptidoglycan/xylan/chitin deacetylase (PgdA/CDA1 family)